ncbi:MAG: ATP cone domain-containing protein, partial [Cellulosilyticaceae bacterium]
MTYYVIKRDGRKVNFDIKKIENAINQSVRELNTEVNTALIQSEVTNKIKSSTVYEISVEQIQDFIEETLLELDLESVKQVYASYR